MSLLVFDQVSLNLGGKTILENVGLRIAQGDRIGLVGPNGCGKTSLMRLIAGQAQPDGGSITQGGSIGYLSQDVSIDADSGLLEFVLSSVPGKTDLETKLAETTHLLETSKDEELLMVLSGQVADMHERLADFEAYYSEHEAKRIMSGLGFLDTDYGRNLGEFSGGWQMRAVLASLLFQRPDLLLLDEPTNHLDMPSVAWFSAFLLKYPLAFVLISHDREFLNEQIGRVVSFEPEGIRSYKGDYTSYKTQREEERVLLEARARNLQKEREHLEQFINRFRAKASKAAQVQSRVKQLEKLGKVELHEQRAVMNFRFPPSERTGRITLEVDKLSKAYGDHVVLNEVDLRVHRGDRIALIGVNGAGKTTLLRTLAGELEKSGGDFEFGHNTKVAYYAQHHSESLPQKSTVYEAIRGCAKDANHQQIRTVLGAMLFGDREVDKLIGVLSGGERARVALAQMLIDPGNVLLMDEPTNHLDLESSERLAESLTSFDGTLLFVSHNRGFIRSLATKIWSVEDGKVVEYPGTFDEYIESCQTRGETSVVESGGPEKKQATVTSNVSHEQRKKNNHARKQIERKIKPLERRCATLEGKIEKLENAQAERNTQLTDPEVFKNSKKQAQINKEMVQAQAEIDVLMSTWTEVQETIAKLNDEVAAVG